MRTVELIGRKRDGEELTEGEVRFLVEGFTKEEIPDYQMSAFLMAVVNRGMTLRESVAMTRAMIESGETIDFPGISDYKVDKHSTGGVGDKVTLVLAPLLGALGFKVPKLSGRGLGHTGGTLDKLESIPGFRTDLALDEFTRIVNEAGVAVAGTTANLVPADQKMYALRDVTATVESIPLIAASILSKKLALATDALVLDVKVGDGAFFRQPEQADEFSRVASAVGDELGREVATVQTGMDQPLGFAIGNALEVREAITTLRGEGPSDLVEVVLALAARLLRSRDGLELDEGAGRARRVLESGAARESFERWIAAQGGEVAAIEDPRRLPAAAYEVAARSDRAGYVRRIRARAIGELAMRLGAGRAKKEDRIDPAAGLVLKVKVGQEVREGDVLAVLHTARGVDEAVERDLRVAFELSEERVEPGPTVIRR
jgi:pyrimidine-nucleoside phosphorylase